MSNKYNGLDIEIVDSAEEPIEFTGVPEEDAEVFRGLRSLALQSMSVLIKEAAELQSKIEESETKPKKDLYTKKFSKVRGKFQDEVARLAQIEHVMKENDIPFDVEEKTETEVDPEEGSEW